ncbi:MAG: AbrB/MazE/SpoVT family DNA-binding domain-containing protein [Actinomycetota bacterium]|nr:AbrB/MazE/SpoVT family DNA-binding domain-containing protein [Actinomycetota bacterium]MDI6822453.1 AbrB/MazE/SpoVT family DNA-binding domain-containing protein [Actinomycetota bacterium]
MAIVKATAKGQIVIPANLRKKYHIIKGTKVKVEEKNGEIVIKPLLTNPIKDARGMFQGGKSALKVLLSDRKEEASR